VDAPKILLIRRDNIGDLVCTTPLIAALRTRYPAARIDLLGNSYNIDVVRHDPRLNNVYAYTKTKHEPGQSALRLYWRRLQLIRALRGVGYDWIVLCQGGYNKRLAKWARWLKGRHVVGLVEPGDASRGLTDAQPALVGAHHEVERLIPLLAPLDARAEPPLQQIFADPARARASVERLRDGRPLVGVHISARRPKQRWPAEHFKALILALHAQLGARVALFWSPGAEDNPMHMGDDAKAAQVLAGLPADAVVACPTGTLAELMADLSALDLYIGADGGAMHLAAGLGKPIVCLFGDSDTVRWRPWGVPATVLQAPDQDVSSISVETVVEAAKALAAQTTQ